MDITITLGDALRLLIYLGILIFLFYMISLIKNLLPSVKSLAKILKDFETVSAVSAEGAEGAKKVVENVSVATDQIAGVIKGNQSSLKAATNLINALTSLARLMKQAKEK